MVRVEGRAEALAEFGALARLPPETDVLGPVELGGGVADRRAAAAADAAGTAVGRAGAGPGGQEVMAIRSARKSDGALRVVVDPVSLG